jgi:hypothetical protein
LRGDGAIAGIAAVQVVADHQPSAIALGRGFNEPMCQNLACLVLVTSELALQGQQT